MARAVRSGVPARSDPAGTAGRRYPGAAPAPPPPVEGLDDAQRRRRSSIVIAAVAMMLTTEYDRIQMKDVSAAAGVALGTTYRYFASKDHLMAEALVAWGARFPAERPAARSVGASSADDLKRAFRLAVRAFAPHPTVYGALTVLQASGDPYAAALFEQFANKQIAAFEHHLPEIPADRRTNIVRVMSAVLHTHLRAWSFGRESIEEVYAMVDVAGELLLGDPALG